MQRSTVLPGTAPLSWYSAASESLSLSATVPASISLPGFSVLDENAEKVPNAASAPAAPMASRERRMLLVRGMAHLSLRMSRRELRAPPAAEPSRVDCETSGFAPPPRDGFALVLDVSQLVGADAYEAQPSPVRLDERRSRRAPRTRGRRRRSRCASSSCTPSRGSPS